MGVQVVRFCVEPVMLFMITWAYGCKDSANVQSLVHRIVLSNQRLRTCPVAGFTLRKTSPNSWLLMTAFQLFITTTISVIKLVGNWKAEALNDVMSVVMAGDSH